MLETKEGQLHKKLFQASSLHQCPANEGQLAAFPDTMEMIGSIQLGKCNPAGNTASTSEELYKRPYNDQYCKVYLEFNRKSGQGLQKTCNVCPLVSTPEDLGHGILHQLKFPDGL